MKRIAAGSASKVALALLIGSLVCAGPAVGQDEGWTGSVFLGFEAQGETDLDPAANGQFEFYMPNFGASASTMLTDDTRLTLQGDYRLIAYDFDVPRVWDTVHVLRLNPMLTYFLDETWSIMGGPIGEFSGESEANFGDSLRGGGNIAVGYRRDNLSIALGILVVSEIEDDPYIQPIVLLNWGVRDGFSVTGQAASSRGGEMRFGYTFLERWTAALGYGFRRERFRLNDDGFGARVDGVGQEEAQLLSGHLRYVFDAGLGIEAYVGTTLDGDFRLESETGNKIADSDYDDAIYGGVIFTVGF